MSKPLIRNYGDPAGEYAAARQTAGVVDRADRGVIRVWGREPLKMLQGLLTNDLAGAPAGSAVEAALLTPKGRMLADVRALRREGDILLDVHRDAIDGVLEHLKKVLPPIFARYEDAKSELGIIGVYGPDADDIAAHVLGGALPEGEHAMETRAFEGDEVLATRTGYAGVPGWDLVAPRSTAERLREAVEAGGARPMGHGALEALRIEAGTPRWGAELDDTVIPLEAGLQQRMISTSKGCYTGQEVIIRILHRGHVNRHLRRLRFGDSPAPSPGEELFRSEADAPDGRANRALGRVTSSCLSPRDGETIGIGYVRREVEPPAVLRLGSPEGREVRVEALPEPGGA